MYVAEDLIGPEEAAAMLGVSPTRLASMVRERHLAPVVELRRCRIYDRGTVLALAAARAEQARTDPRMKTAAV